MRKLDGIVQTRWKNTQIVWQSEQQVWPCRTAAASISAKTHPQIHRIIVIATA